MKRLIISIMATIMCAFGAVAVVTNFTTTGANAVVESHSLDWNHKRGADNLPCTGGTLLWIFTGQTATSATLYLNGNAYPGDQRGNGAYPPVHDARNRRDHQQQRHRAVHGTCADQRGRHDLALHQRPDQQSASVDRFAAVHELTAGNNQS